MNRRDFLKLAGFGSAIFLSGLPGSARWADAAAAGSDGFLFVQMSDLHWGFSNAAVNPDSTGTLRKAIAAVNALEHQPDFIIFTGDLTHTTDDEKERRKRLTEVREITAGLKVKTLRYMPGEHDAGLDEGAAFKEIFGNTHYTFDHKGVHFIVLDNVSDPTGSIGEKQLRWLAADLGKQGKDARITIFTHRPLFDLAPDWDWHTRDGAKALELLKLYGNVPVFYGHIHQENHRTTGSIDHHSATGLMYPLPAPYSVPKKMPVPWDPSEPYKGLGWRSVDAKVKQKMYGLTEYGVKGEKL
ncbi:MAG TPA: metallophosphoesterase [Syntrophales bacterium]|nr:metallophosphoesterase [Syntrophales bacterium]